MFLLSGEKWLELTHPLEICEPYILCYYLSVTPTAVRFVNKLRKITGYKVIYLNHNAIDKFGCDKEIRDYDPIDFISYISHATIVCTNSFHCSAFSIIFERSFYFVPGLRNKRVEALQEVFELGDRFVSEKLIETITIDSIPISYDKGRDKSCDYINESVDYLKKSLNLK